MIYFWPLFGYLFMKEPWIFLSRLTFKCNYERFSVIVKRNFLTSMWSQKKINNNKKSMFGFVGAFRAHSDCRQSELCILFISFYPQKVRWRIWRQTQCWTLRNIPSGNQSDIGRLRQIGELIRLCTERDCNEMLSWLVSLQRKLLWILKWLYFYLLHTNWLDEGHFKKTCQTHLISIWMCYRNLKTVLEIIFSSWYHLYQKYV